MLMGEVTLHKSDILKNIESLFLSAISEGNYASALKAQELLSKYTGVFDIDKIDVMMETIKMLDKEELEKLIEALGIEINENDCELVAGEGLEPPTRGL